MSLLSAWVGLCLDTEACGSKQWNGVLWPAACPGWVETENLPCFHPRNAMCLGRQKGKRDREGQKAPNNRDGTWLRQSMICCCISPKQQALMIMFTFLYSGTKFKILPLCDFNDVRHKKPCPLTPIGSEASHLRRWDPQGIHDHCMYPWFRNGTRNEVWAIPA